MIHHSPLVLSTGTTPCARLSLGRGRSVGQVCRATNGGYPPSFSLSLLGANKEHSNYFGCAVSGWSMRSSPLLHSSLTYSLPFLHTFRISDSQGPLRHCGPQWPNQATNGNGVGVFVGLSLSLVGSPKAAEEAAYSRIKNGQMRMRGRPTGPFIHSPIHDPDRTAESVSQSVVLGKSATERRGWKSLAMHVRRFGADTKRRYVNVYVCIRTGGRGCVGAESVFH